MPALSSPWCLGRYSCQSNVLTEASSARSLPAPERECHSCYFTIYPHLWTTETPPISFCVYFPPFLLEFKTHKRWRFGIILFTCVFWGIKVWYTVSLSKTCARNGGLDLPTRCGERQVKYHQKNLLTYNIHFTILTKF